MYSQQIDARGILYEICTQTLTKMHVSLVICYKCHCCGKEFYTIDYDDRSYLSRVVAEAH